MDFGIEAKLKLFEQNCNEFNGSKKQRKALRKDLDDIIYYIKKEYKRGTITNLDLIKKYENMYFSLK